MKPIKKKPKAKMNLTRPRYSDTPIMCHFGFPSQKPEIPVEIPIVQLPNIK